MSIDPDGFLVWTPDLLLGPARPMSDLQRMHENRDCGNFMLFLHPDGRTHWDYSTQVIARRSVTYYAGFWILEDVPVGLRGHPDPGSAGAALSVLAGWLGTLGGAIVRDEWAIPGRDSGEAVVEITSTPGAVVRSLLKAAHP